MSFEKTVCKEKRQRSAYRFKAKKGGEWKHDADLIADLISGRRTLDDEEIQKELLDWILTDNCNVFRNKQTGELVYALAAKRGNPLYAAKKGETLNRILAAIANRELDYAHPKLRESKYRYTHVLLVTVTFDPKRYTKERTWSLLRSNQIEDFNFEHGVLNKFGANISSIFGLNGKITCKESNSSGYPAPHIIIVLDKPVLVERHIDKDGSISWRLVNDQILKRVGKDKHSRRMSRLDVEQAILNNPIWTHGTMDIKGVVKKDRFKKFSNGFTYLFKYLIKTVSIERYPELMDMESIGDSDNKSVRTMIYTHLGNKCFRTRDIVFGKAFKDRIGLLPVERTKSELEWERVKTIPKWVVDILESEKPSSDNG